MNTPDPHTPSPKTGVGAAVSTAISAPTPPREEDPRTRAARRALELREHKGGSMDDGVDKFYIDPRIIPDGWSYEWKRHTLLGKEDPSYQVALAQKGWEAVPRARHPFMMPDGHQGETIEREGQILMERPKEITDEVVSHDKRKAREQVRGKEEQLGMAPAGQFERDGHPQTRPSIKKSYESIPIPDK
jgi:hypothetical protein